MLFIASLEPNVQNHNEKHNTDQPGPELITEVNLVPEIFLYKL
jgi:hypothetical protein